MCRRLVDVLQPDSLLDLLLACVQGQICQLQMIWPSVRDANASVDVDHVLPDIRAEELVVEVHDCKAIVGEVCRNDEVRLSDAERQPLFHEQRAKLFSLSLSDVLEVVEMARQNHSVQSVADLREIARDMLPLGLDRTILTEVFDVAAGAPRHMGLDEADVLTLNLRNLVMYAQLWPHLLSKMLEEDLERGVDDDKVLFLELTPIFAIGFDLLISLPSDQVRL